VELSKNNYKLITEALIKASNFSKTEWLNMEKYILESISSGQPEMTSSNVFEMWNQLHRKIEGSIDRMKLKE